MVNGSTKRVHRIDVRRAHDQTRKNYAQAGRGKMFRRFEFRGTNEDAWKTIKLARNWAWLHGGEVRVLRRVPGIDVKEIGE